MRLTNSSDQFNVAWFKLAEFVRRGEKERALGLFKLLMHSLDNRALARQLHGDILLSFEDSQAIDSYQQAAEIFEEMGKFRQAAAIYEHLITLVDDELMTNKLIELYGQLETQEAIRLTTKRLIPLLVETGNTIHAQEQLAVVEPLCTDEQRLGLLQAHVFAQLKHEDRTLEEQLMLTKPLIELLMQRNSTQFNRALNHLETLYPSLYEALTATLQTEG